MALSPEYRSPRPSEGTAASFPHRSSGAKCLGAEEGSAVFFAVFHGVSEEEGDMPH